MTQVVGTLHKIKIATAAEAADRAALGDKAAGLLTPELALRDYLDRLLAADLLEDAVKLMAHALPKREAVWWACLAARPLVDDATPAVRAALEAAEAWVYRPSEETRRAAMDKAAASGFRHPAAWAAMGAFWSGGSMAPPDLPAVPPAEHFTALAVAGALGLAAVMKEPAQAQAKRRLFIDQAIDIANGGSGRPKAG